MQSAAPVRVGIGRAGQVRLLGFAGHILDLHESQPRPRARQIDEDRLAQPGIVGGLVVIRQIRADLLGREQFFAGKGFRDVFTDKGQNCPLPNFCGGATAPNPSKPQYTLFMQTKFIF